MPGQAARAHLAISQTTAWKFRNFIIGPPALTTTVSMKDAYVPHHIGKYDPESDPDEAVVKMFARSPVSVFFGERGIGKTTLLRNTIWRLTVDQRNEINMALIDVLGVYICLSELNIENTQSFEQVVTSHLRSIESRVESRGVADILKAGQVLLLLDEIDRIAPKDLDRLFEKLSEFLKTMIGRSPKFCCGLTCCPDFLDKLIGKDQAEKPDNQFSAQIFGDIRAEFGRIMPYTESQRQQLIDNILACPDYKESIKRAEAQRLRDAMK
jgi:hypothetical protein